ncbi:MAG: hypothetical protein L3I99_00720 [Sulfurimonas sp.]|nr:hypothetical protein [Sulfurimonas sp.]
MVENIHIVFIPPSGQFKKQDFSLQRIAKWLNEYDEIKTTLVHIKPIFELDTTMFDKVIQKNNQAEIIPTLKTIKYNMIFHRTWMTNYEFAAELVKEFDSVSVNIKDWNFAPKDVYEFLYPSFKDYEAIGYIFKNCNHILSHFTKKQAKLWAKEYDTKREKFIFFPEYCNKNSFNKKPVLKYKNIHLVYAGAISPSTKPEDYFPGKSHIRAIKSLTKQGINIDFVLPQHIYDFTMKSVDVFKDFIYEKEINKKFNIIKGKSLDSSVLNKYHFGFFELEASGLNHTLYKYALTSKFAFYLEAGLPMLINDKFVSMAKIIKEHKLGIVFNNNELENMSAVLDISQTEYDKFILNIQKYRKKFIYKKKHLKMIGLLDKKGVVNEKN